MSKIKAATIRKIVTHPGKAHRDEFLAIALVLAYMEDNQILGVNIERREATRQDTLENGVLVLDTGGGEFDHHQLPQAAPACCTLTLVLKDLGLLEEAYAAWPWLATTEVMDSKGPRVAAKALQAEWPRVSPLWMNPVELWALRFFETCYMLNDCKQVLLQVGNQLRSELAALKAATKQLDQLAQRRMVSGVEVIDLRFTDKLDGVMQWKARHVPHAAVSILKDDRGEGFTLYRYDDDKRVDFREIKHLPGVTFVHSSGFLAKVEPAYEGELLNLIQASLSKLVVRVKTSSFTGGGLVLTHWMPRALHESGAPMHYSTELLVGNHHSHQTLAMTQKQALQTHDALVRKVELALTELKPDGTPPALSEVFK